MKEIYKLFLDELDFFAGKSGFAHAQAQSFSGAGELVEVGIRKFLREVIGERFKITHGYIYSSSQKKLSRQIDIIITDKLVPHSFKKFDYLDQMEIVPAEAVVGVFEIKRTLTSNSLKDAIKHLADITDFVPLVKDRKSRFLAGGIEVQADLMGGKFSNPIIGVLSLLRETSDHFESVDLPSFIDVVFSFDGYLKAWADPNSSGLKVISCHEPEIKNSYRTFVVINKSDEAKETFDKNRTKILCAFVAYLLQYLNEVSGRTFSMNDYFQF